ncbi:MFS transporter [Streptomyces sp. MW-W600-10]|uniref:MFS transporter n=1 Tax=Streptomyces sp. MW-W600-10 TaxID=2829819 RepID=UPI001C443AE2|nr:MFS transporter [Streptomyces sp. MW-W600-10]MBV7246968.1 MFS transporter [Streptomyces sp. MW-W600-10]
MTPRPRTGPGRGWLLRLVIAFAFAQGAVSMARPAVSYRALALGADEAAVGVIAGVYALLPLFVAVPLGRRTDHGRCAPLLPLGVLLISGGCALSGIVSSLPAMAAWSGVMGLGHLCFVIGAQSIVARQSAPDEQDRNFGHFTIGASLGQLIGPIAAGALISADSGALGRTSALALLVSAGVCAVALTSLWRIEHRRSTGSGTALGHKVPVRAILGARGVPAGIFISMAVLSATDILTAYLPVVGEHRSIAPATVGLLLSLRAAATIACRLVMTPLLRLLGRRALLTTSCLLAGLLCAGVALPVSVPVLAVMLAVLGFCLGVGQPLSMTTVVRAAPAQARSTALALRLTGNRLGQVAAPAAAGLIAGAVGVAAPFALLGVLLLGAAGLGLRGEARTKPAPPAADTAPTPVPPDPALVPPDPAEQDPVPPDPAPVPPDPAEQDPVPPDATPVPPAVRNGADPSG